MQHVHYEGLGCIEEWILANGHQLTSTKFYADGDLPELESFDWLIIMGGPMGVNDGQQYPWIEAEKAFIRNAIDKGKKVLGICLGAQLIAHVLGAKVYPNKVREIGWFSIRNLHNENFLFGGFPEYLTVFHWHGDTFELPEKAMHIFSNTACSNQGFLFHHKVLALQFHFEVTEKALRLMVANGSHELVPGDHIQPAEVLLAYPERVKENNESMFLLLNKFAAL